MRRPTPGRIAATVGAVLVVVLAAATQSTSSAFSAQVTNSTDTVATAPFFTCAGAETSPGRAANYLTYPLNENPGLVTLGVTAQDISGNARTGTYSATGVTYAQPGPCRRDTPNRAVTLDGASGYVIYAGGTQNTNVFSEEVWFRTTTTRGGKIVGFGSSNTVAASGNNDRHVYMTNAGTLIFGVYPGAVRTVTSPAAYNDGAWHQLVATLSTAGMVLYVDGAQVARDPGTTTAQDYAGYLHLGYDNLNNWPNQPTSSYFAGSLAFAAYYTTALTAQQVKDHYVAGT